MRTLVSKYGKMYDALLNMPLNIEIDIAKEQVNGFVRSVACLDQENMRNLTVVVSSRCRSAKEQL